MKRKCGKQLKILRPNHEAATEPRHHPPRVSRTSAWAALHDEKMTINLGQHVIHCDSIHALDVPWRPQLA